MATDLERLVVTLEASTKQYTNEMKKVRSETNSMFRAMQGEITANTRRVESQMASMGGRAVEAFRSSFVGMFRGFGAGLIAQIGIEQFGEAIRGAVKDVADLGDTAADLGVSAQALQVWSRLATEAGADTQQMAKALADVAQQGQDTGSKLSALFQSMGRAVTGDVTTDMLTLMNILERMETPTQRLATLMDVFGDRVGRGLAESLTQGSDAYFKTLHGMEQAGDLFTDKQIADARRLDAEWNVLMDHLSARWHKFVLDGISAWGNFVQEIEQGIAKIGQGDFSDSAISQIWKKLFGEAPATPAIGGGAPGAAPSSLKGSATQSQIDALVEAAAELGVSAKDLATVIAYETKGTFSPSIVGGTGNRYQGLIQFGPAEREQFGASISQTFEEQMKSVVAYLKARGVTPGMGLLDLYSTINAGSPGRYGASDRPGMTVSTHVAQMGPFAEMAKTWLESARQEIREAAGLPAGHVGTPGYQQAPLVAGPGQKLPEGFDLSGIKSVDEATKSWTEYNDALSAVERSTGQMTASQMYMIASMKDVISGVKQVNDALASSVETFTTQLLDGASASDALKSALRQLAQQMLHMAIQGLFNFGGASGGLLGALVGLPAKAPGFATGGSFQVGGAGGTDSRMVAFRATPGEFVDISRPGMRGGRGGGASISMGGIAIHVAGSADERTLAIMERRLAQAQAKQMQDIQRNWGVMTSRYQAHRGP